VNRNGDDWPPGLAPPHAVVDHVGQLAALLGARRR
jgi:hypothetical protein